MQEILDRIKEKVCSKGLKLGAVLTVQEVEAFEKKYSITLPEGYREFLLQIGNGGDGPPYYNLHSLGGIPDDYHMSEYGDKLTRKFPFKEGWVWEEEEETPELNEKLDQTEYGNLILGTDGCGMYWILIVTGEERGQIWNTADVGIQPCCPGVSFLEWYEYWLDGGEDWWRDFVYEE